MKYTIEDIPSMVGKLFLHKNTRVDDIVYKIESFDGDRVVLTWQHENIKKQSTFGYNSILSWLNTGGYYIKEDDTLNENYDIF